MKKKILICLLYSFTSSLLMAQIYTETFEGVTGSGKPNIFINNGQSFTAITNTPGGSLGGFFGVYIPGNNWIMPNPGGGPFTNGPGGFGVGTGCIAGSCTGVSNKFLDNGSSSGKGQAYSIKATNGNVYSVKSVHLFFSSDNGNNNVAPATLIIYGKKAGATIFTITKTSGFITGFGINNGFNYIDFVKEGGIDNSNKAIDEIEFKCDGTVNYFALDNFTWSPVSGSLPLQLLDFAGSRLGSTISLHWRTTAEINLGYFDLQRSNDASNWLTVDRQLAKGTLGANSNEYTSAQNNVADLNFYRLKMVDKDGRFALSKVLMFRSESSDQIIIYPNPVKDKMVIYLPAAGTVLVQFINSKGILIKTIRLNNSSSIVNLSMLTPGIYIVKITQGALIKMEKIIKL